jgi:hypothetical protein
MNSELKKYLEGSDRCVIEIISLEIFLEALKKTIIDLSHDGRDIAQADNRCLPTSAARVCAQSVHVGFVVDGVTLGQIFCKYFRFSLPIIFPPISPLSYSPGAGTIGQLVADVPSGPSGIPCPTIRFFKRKSIQRYIYSGLPVEG